MITRGQRVQTEAGGGYVYSIENDWAAVTLDKNSHRSNPPVYWAKLAELESREAGEESAAPAQPANSLEAMQAEVQRRKQ